MKFGLSCLHVWRQIQLVLQFLAVQDNELIFVHSLAYQEKGKQPYNSAQCLFSWILCTFPDPPWHCTCGWILSRATQDGELLTHLSPISPSFASQYIGPIITWSKVHPPWYAVGHKHLNLEIMLTVILSSWGRPNDKFKCFLALHSKLPLGAGRWFFKISSHS